MGLHQQHSPFQPLVAALAATALQSPAQRAVQAVALAETAMAQQVVQAQVDKALQAARPPAALGAAVAAVAEQAQLAGMEVEMAALREKLQAKAALAALQLLEITLPSFMPVVVVALTLAT